MRTYFILIAFLSFNFANSQSEICTIKQIQLETYDFVKVHIDSVRKNISDHDALIEVTIFMKSQKIVYSLISPEDSYSGKNKTEIEVWNELDDFIKRKIKICSNDKYILYDELKYRVPLSNENIEKAIDQVNEIAKVKQ